MRHCRFMFLFCTLTLLAACTGAPFVDEDPATYVTLKLWTSTNDFKITYFEIKPDGELLFGGGRRAAQHTGTHVTVLTDGQRRQIVDLIHRHRLLDASGSTFTKPQRVKYDVTLETTAGRNGFSCVDEQAPGLQELHDTLFQIQANTRYEKVAPTPTQ